MGPQTSEGFFATKKVYKDGFMVKLQLWDTAGISRFRALVRLVYNAAWEPF